MSIKFEMTIILSSSQHNFNFEIYLGQVAEALHSIHNLQTRENSLQQELVMVKQFMEAAQVEGEEDRIRMMQTEDELISLQAEMEDVYLRAEVAETEVKNHSIEAASLNNQIEQLMKELDTVKVMMPKLGKI